MQGCRLQAAKRFGLNLASPVPATCGNYDCALSDPFTWYATSPLSRHRAPVLPGHCLAMQAPLPACLRTLPRPSALLPARSRWDDFFGNCTANLNRTCHVDIMVSRLRLVIHTHTAPHAPLTSLLKLRLLSYIAGRSFLHAVRCGRAAKVRGPLLRFQVCSMGRGPCTCAGLLTYSVFTQAGGRNVLEVQQANLPDRCGGQCTRPPAHGIRTPCRGGERAACAECGCWEGASGSVRNSTAFMRRAISYLDSDPRVLKCVLYSHVLRCRAPC